MCVLQDPQSKYKTCATKTFVFCSSWSCLVIYAPLAAPDIIAKIQFRTYENIMTKKLVELHKLHFFFSEIAGEILHVACELNDHCIKIQSCTNCSRQILVMEYVFSLVKKEVHFWHTWYGNNTLITIYLHWRSSAVELGSSVSSSQPSSSGFPQGLCLGPVLLFIYAPSGFNLSKIYCCLLYS